MDTQAITPGTECHHYRPSSGRIIRCVEVVELRGDAALVRKLLGQDAGGEYIVGLDKLSPIR